MKKITPGFLWRVEWSNPYTLPPEGLPRVLAEMYVLSDGTSGAKQPVELDSFQTIGTGYKVSVQAISKPTTPLPRETLIDLRLKRLKKRMQKKYPMFAEQFIQDALAEKHQYYNGYSEHDIARENAIQKEWDAYQRLIKQAGKLQVYGMLPQQTIQIKNILHQPQLPK